MAGTSRVDILLMAFVPLVVGVSLVLPLVVGISLVAGIPLVEVLLLLNDWPCSPSCLRNIAYRKNCECCPGHYLSTSVY